MPDGTVGACLVTGDINCGLWWLSHSSDLLAWHLADCDDFLTHLMCWHGTWQTVMTFSLSWLVGMALGRLWWLLFLFGCVVGMGLLGRLMMELAGLWWLLLPFSWLVGMAFGRLEWHLSTFSSFGTLRWPVFLYRQYSTSLSFRGNWSHLPTQVRLCAATARPVLPILTCACNIFPVSKQMVSLPVLAIVSACTAVDAYSCTLCMCYCTGTVQTPS